MIKDSKQIGVSIITPYFYSEKYIAKAYESIVAQTYKDWEWIIINDGTEGESRKYIETLVENDHRLTLLHQENKKQGAARNAGATIAKGEYLAFLDSDDWFEPDKLEKQLAYALKNNTELVFTAAYIVTEGNDSEQTRIHDVEIPTSNGDDLCKKLIESNRYILSSCLIKKSAFNSVGGFSEEIAFRGTEDYHLWLKVAKKGYSFGYIHEKLTSYLIRADSEMTNICKRYEGTLLAILDVFGNDADLENAVNLRLRKLIPRLLLRSLQAENWALYEKWCGIASEREIPIFLPQLVKCLPKPVRNLLFKIVYSK